MAKHGHAAGDVGQEDDAGEVSKDVFGGAAKTRSDFALAIVALLVLGYGQGFSARALDDWLSVILSLLGIVHAVPGRAGDECHQQHQGVDVLGLPENQIDQVGAAMVGAMSWRRGVLVVGHHGGLQDKRGESVRSKMSRDGPTVGGPRRLIKKRAATAKGTEDNRETEGPR